MKRTTLVPFFFLAQNAAQMRGDREILPPFKGYYTNAVSVERENHKREVA